MPWDYRPWGCGSGSKGSCNSGWIQFEICEDGLTDKTYLDKGDRAVIDKSEDGKNAICSPVKASDLAVIGKTASAETYRIHTVVHGDTLWAIAQKYLGKGARYTEIVKLNDLKSNVIYTGMKLKIPN